MSDFKDLINVMQKKRKNKKKRARSISDYEILAREAGMRF